MEQENRGKRRKSRPVKPEQAAEERQQAADKRPRGKLRWRWLFNTLGATLVVVAVAAEAMHTFNPTLESRGRPISEF